MNSKLKQRVVNNSDITLNKNETILKECYDLYTNNQHGLVKIAKSLAMPILAPRKKISIMLIGNHSAGKSSFINWYIEEHVQKTGVAIETQGFALVTSGKRRETLTGCATMHLFPHYKPLSKFSNLTEYLTTEISTSKQKRFPLVTFIDTPGLVDGDMKYPFDVDSAILWMGNVVDLVFVFFDPIGQALCKRTLNIVEELNKKISGKIKFCLSKADEAGHESDRQRVMMQIVQEVCKRPGLNGTCFDMPTIYIPHKSKPVRCVNQIDDLCRNIDRTIDLTIQNTLNQLEKDCDKISNGIIAAIKDDDCARWNNFVDITKCGLYLILACFICLAVLLDVFVSVMSSDNMVNLRSWYLFSHLQKLHLPIQLLRQIVPEGNSVLVTTLIVTVIVTFIIIRLLKRAQRPVLSKKRKNMLLEQCEYVSSHVNSVKDKLYRQYLEQAVWEQDL